MEKFAYTNRDYESIKKALMARARQLTPEWTDFSENDLGMVLIELFAGMGDMLSYTIDRVANECFLPTAMERQSILNMAKLTGYTPHGARAARTMVCLKWDDVKEAKTIQLPLRMLFTGPEGMKFSFDPWMWIGTSGLAKGFEDLDKNSGIYLSPCLFQGDNVFEIALATVQKDWYTIRLDKVYKLCREELSQRPLLDIRLCQINLWDQKTPLRPIVFHPKPEEKNQNKIVLGQDDLYFNRKEPSLLEFRLDKNSAIVPLFLIQYIFGEEKKQEEKSCYCLEKDALVVYHPQKTASHVWIEYQAKEEGKKIFEDKISQGIKSEKIKEKNSKYYIQLPSDFYALRLGLIVKKKEENKVPIQNTLKITIPNNSISLKIQFLSTEIAKTQTDLQNVQGSLSVNIPNETYYGPVQKITLQTREWIYIILNFKKESDLFVLETNGLPQHIDKTEFDKQDTLFALGDYTITKKDNKYKIENKNGLDNNVSISVRVPVIVSHPAEFTSESYAEWNSTNKEEEILVYTERIQKTGEPKYCQQFPWPKNEKGEKVEKISIPLRELECKPQNGPTFLQVKFLDKNFNNIDSCPCSEVSVLPKDNKDTDEAVLDTLMHPSDLKVTRGEKKTLRIYLPLVQGEWIKDEKAVTTVKEESQVIARIQSKSGKKLAEEGFIAIGIEKGQKTFLEKQSHLWECISGKPHYCIEWEENTAVFRIPSCFPMSKIVYFYNECDASKGNIGASSKDVHLLKINTQLVPAQKEVIHPFFAEGGAEEESVEKMRENISKAVSKRERLVTIGDYESLLREFSDIAHFRIIPSSNLPHELVLYVAPAMRGIPGQGYLSSMVKAELLQKIQRQKMLTASVSLSDPEYVDIEISFVAHLSSNVVDKEGLKKRLKEEIVRNINSLSFYSVVDAGDIYKTVVGYPEIRYIANPAVKRCYVLQGRLVFDTKTSGQGQNPGLYTVKLSNIEDKNQSFDIDDITGCFCLILSNYDFKREEGKSLAWQVDTSSKDTKTSGQGQNPALYTVRPYFFDETRYPFKLIKAEGSSANLPASSPSAGGIKLEKNELPRISHLKQISISFGDTNG